jgi:hypothetical protein
LVRLVDLVALFPFGRIFNGLIGSTWWRTSFYEWDILLSEWLSLLHRVW